ncbi:L,D-transpeptidase family protein [Clostridium lundense]|uniref:L,D-transpeptidase family protein n=1 Tax=Clostridium lundense TaxID=319475 RepID=UPI0006873419|nr:L,D-transpeptidase family protein [Clostridium lundense]
MKRICNFTKALLPTFICAIVLTGIPTKAHAANSVPSGEIGQTINNKTEEKVVIIPPIENTILKNASMKFNNSTVYETSLTPFLINSNYDGKVNYRVFLHSLDKNEWTDLSVGYTLDRNGKDPYQVNIFRITSGNYEIVTFAKNANSEGNSSINIEEYNVKYDDYKIQRFQCIKNGEPKLNVTVKNKTPLYEGASQEVTLETDGYHGLVEYKVWLYSNNTKKWTNITTQPGKEINSEEAYNIPTGKLSAGSYKLSIRVKKAESQGSQSDNLGDYDDIKNIDISVIKKPTPGPTVPSAPKIEPMYVGNDNENSKIRIRKDASTSSAIVGGIYGSTQEVKVLGKKGNFYYVQAKDYDTLNEVKGYIRSDYIKQVTPSSNYSIVVDISDQKVYIYKNNKLNQTFICSTGMDATPTPTGRYLIGGRGESFGREKGYLCYNFVRINHDYLFHSVLHYVDGSIIQEEYKKLGKKASHGCIRLKDENIKWIYNNIPRNTLVVIQN